MSAQNGKAHTCQPASAWVFAEASAMCTVSTRTLTIDVGSRASVGAGRFCGGCMWIWRSGINYDDWACQSSTYHRTCQLRTHHKPSRYEVSMCGPTNSQDVSRNMPAFLCMYFWCKRGKNSSDASVRKLLRTCQNTKTPVVSVTGLHVSLPVS